MAVTKWRIIETLQILIRVYDGFRVKQSRKRQLIASRFERNKSSKMEDSFPFITKKVKCHLLHFEPFKIMV